jgi:biopolymer transport protein ExbD
MGMNVGNDDSDDLMVEMNTTPLVDVMLVLLIMLIITIPLQTHAVKLDMPQATEELPPSDPTIVRLDVNAEGQPVWNGEIVDDPVALENLLAAAAIAVPPPEIHLRPDPQARYDTVAKILSAAQRLQVTRIGFVGNERYMQP